MSPTGEKRWKFLSYAGFWTRHGMIDLEGDGAMELVGGNGDIASDDSLFFLNGQDVFCKRILNDGWGSALSSMEIADINGDGKREIIIGTRRGNLHAIAPDREGYLWSRTLGHEVSGCQVLHTPSGSIVVAGCQSGFVVAYDGSGRKAWATSVGAPVLFLDTIGDDVGLVAALRDGTLVQLDVAGNTVHHANLASVPTAICVVGEAHDLAIVAGTDGVVRAVRLRP